MSLNEFIFDSMENLDTIYIDYGKYTKQLTSGLYEVLQEYQVDKWYLDIKDNKPCIVIVLDF